MYQSIRTANGKPNCGLFISPMRYGFHTQYVSMYYTKHTRGQKLQDFIKNVYAQARSTGVTGPSVNGQTEEYTEDQCQNYQKEEIKIL